MKPVRELSIDELFEIVATDIEAYQNNGGDYLKDKNLELTDDPEVQAEIEGLWARAKPPPKPVAEPSEVSLAPQIDAGLRVSEKPQSDFRPRIGGARATPAHEDRASATVAKPKPPSLISSGIMDKLRAIADQGKEYSQEEEEPETEPEAVETRVEVIDEVISNDILDQIITEKPKPVLALPGVAGEIQEYYFRIAMQPSDIMSLAPALMVPTALMCGNVIGPSGPKGCSLHRYLILLGPTSSGKQTVIDLTKECLQHAGVKTMIGPNRFKSGPGLVRWVSENRVSLCVQDEFGKLLAKIGNQKANISELEINERMRELWGLGPDSIYNGPVGAAKDDNMVAIKEPHLNILGVGVREEFYSVCSDTDQVNGFLNRLDLLEEPRMVRPRNVDHQQFPFKLITQLSKLHALKRQQMPWTKGAKEIWEAELDRVYSQTDERKIKLWARTPEKIVMAGTVFSGCRFAKQVERSDMEKAQAFLRLSDEVFRRGIDDAEKKKVLDYAELKLEIERRIVADFANAATEFQIKNSFRHNTKYKNAVGDAVADMVESGTLEKQTVRASNGKPKIIHSVVEQS